MRTTILVLGIAVLVVAVLAACRAQGDAADDSATSDNSGVADTTEDSGIAAADTTSSAKSRLAASRPRTTPDVRRAPDSSNDATDDTGGLDPRNAPRAPSGEARNPAAHVARIQAAGGNAGARPVESIRRVEHVPDSVLPADTTKPPKPDR